VPLASARPPEELRAGAITLVRYRGGEGRDLARAVAQSIDHLQPWMPWAAGPPSEDEQEAFVRRVVEQWGNGTSFSYWLREEETSLLVGSVGLHRRLGPDAIEIGYWVHAERTRRGYATSASRALTSAGLGLAGVKRTEIHCDEANQASAAVARGLGYRLDRIEDDDVEAPGEVGRSMIWIMDAESWNP
jgi:RimJ/RimL family protein N-acetyltransferase